MTQTKTRHMIWSLLLLSMAIVRVVNSQSVVAGSLRLPALGRPFSLGALYDIRQDKLVAPGVTLWDRKTLNESVFHRPSPYTGAKVVAQESIADKASAFELSAEITANFLSGLIKVGGSAKYLDEQRKSNYEASMTFLYKRKTHMRELGMEHLATLEHPKILDKVPEATHVVTRIVYGANAVFTFTKEARDFTNKRQIEGSLQVALDFVAASVDGRASLNMTDSEKRKYMEFRCEFKGDVSLKRPPTNLADAIKIYQELPSQITENTAVPITVYLYPLSKLDSTKNKIIRQISSDLLAQVQQRMEQYNELERDIGDMMRSPVYRCLPLLRNHIDSFHRAVLSVHKNQFQRQLLKILPEIRGGAKTEIKLADLLNEQYTNFSIRSMKDWVREKKVELGALEPLCTWRPEIVLTSPGDIEPIIYGHEYQYAVLLNLKLYALEDPFTLCFLNKCAAKINQSSWLNPSTGYKLRKQLEQFIEAATQANQTDTVEISRTKFAITENKQITDAKNQAEISVQIYDNGRLADPDFQFPHFYNVEASSGCHDNKSVSWSVTFLQGVTANVFVSYKDERAGKWISQDYAGNKALIIQPDGNCNETLCGGSQCKIGPKKGSVTWSAINLDKNTGAIVSVVSDIQVKLTIYHTYVADLRITLLSPSGRSVLLFNRTGGSSDNFVGTNFRQDANLPMIAVASRNRGLIGSYQPAESFDILRGDKASGKWQLKIEDLADGDTGYLLHWELCF